ncbi:hypothetical protein JW960_16945 [candidate division KSB1 bacterium]|nr:hypothetical protein [candidate division KSB1 bacterium]
MPSNWENIKRTVKGELSSAAAASKKYARIGIANISKMNIRKSMDSAYQDLGEEVYNQVSDGTKGDISKSKKVKKQIAKVNQFKQSIEDKDLEIETIKQDAVSEIKTDDDSNSPAKAKAEKTALVNKENRP